MDKHRHDQDGSSQDQVPGDGVAESFTRQGLNDPEQVLFDSATFKAAIYMKVTSTKIFADGLPLSFAVSATVIL
jgi:hypothetical protein